MMLLIITVAPNLANTAEARRGREAARMVSSFVAKAQSRAIGRTDWSGFMLAATNTTSSFAAIDLFLADVPPAYRGDTVPALLTINTVSVASAVATGAAGQLTLSGTWSGGAGVQTWDLIRFQGSGSLYEVGSVSPTSIQFRPRSGAGAGNANAIESAGFSAHNTPWPPSGVPLAFEVLRQPVPAGSPLTLGESRAVDLYWSGIGPPMLTVGATVFGAAAYRPLSTTGTAAQAAGASTAVMFDGTGRLRQAIVRSGATVRRITITGPLYLLVGRADRVISNPTDLTDPNHPGNFDPANDSTGANWQYSDSWWIAIDPATGVVKTAECTPNPSGSTDLERCVSSQAWIRQSLLGDGR
jgi:hypothetical protein